MPLCFQSKISFDWLFWNFTPVLCEHVTTSSTYYHEKCVLIYKLKDFRWWNFDTQFECTGVLISKVTNWEAPISYIFILFEIAWVKIYFLLGK